MLKDSAADLWHFLTSNRIKILLKRYIFNHYKSCIQMMLLVRLRATKPRNLRKAGNPGIAGTGTFYWFPQCSVVIPPPQSHILISANRNPGCWCFHTPSISLQPKHKDAFSWRSIWIHQRSCCTSSYYWMGLFIFLCLHWRLSQLCQYHTSVLYHCANNI